MDNILKETDVYVNYDFATNWDKIVKLLKNKRFFNKIYGPIIDEYKFLKKHDTREKEYLYKNKSIEPSDLSSKDFMFTILNDICDKLIRIKDPRIPTEILENYWPDYNTSDEENSDDDDKIIDYGIEIMKSLYLDWTIDKYSIHHWIPNGNCHFFNAHFGLMVANKLMPDKKWKIFSTDSHTTIVCFEDKIFFDILVWGCSNLSIYLNNQIFNETSEFIDNNKIAEEIIDELYAQKYVKLENKVNPKTLFCVEANIMIDILKYEDRYTNYDFAQNWNKIKTLLKDDTFFNKLYRPIITEYKNKKPDDINNENDLFLQKIIKPCELTDGNDDYFFWLDNDICNQIIETRDQRISDNEWSVYDSMEKCPEEMFEDEYYNSKIYLDRDEVFAIQILKKCGINWYSNQYSIYHWALVEQCRFYNKHFGLLVAKTLMPHKNWKIVETPTHATVVCTEDKLFFDIITWGSLNIKAHINNKIFGENNPIADNKTIAKDIIDMLYQNKKY